MTSPPGFGRTGRPAGPGGRPFVTWTPGRWHRSDVPGRDPVPVTLDQVLSMLAGAGPPPPVADIVVAEDAGAGGTVAPAWCVVGQPTDAGLVVEDAAGRLVLLTPDDLVVLDTLRGATPRSELLLVDSVDDPVRSLRRLIGAGKARTVDDGPPKARPSPVEPPPVLVGPSGSACPGGPPGRVPVYAVWHRHVGPMLSLGMLTAAARRHDGGALNEVFEIRRPESAESFVADLATRDGPAVLLCSDYVWSVRENLALAREALAVNPALVVVHGGPSCPKYAGDAERFLAEHGDVAHVLVHGEGEQTVCELLAALAPSVPVIDPDRLAGVAGVSYVDPRVARVVRTADRPRIADLDALASPYLTGEYDHIPLDAWWYGMSVETNRGCPYGCTFCDWGSATLSRIRMFAPERVAAEVAWGAARGIHGVTITDANFGIMSRDVETAQRIAGITREQGRPTWVSVSPAKNTMRHLARIMDVFLDVGVVPTMSISLQTTDAATADAIDRNSIPIDQYVELAADHRRRGFPLLGDVLVGLPEQTYQSFRNDLQFNLDHEILVRTWPVQLLPNAPMNDPAYRERYGIVVDDENIVVATSSFTPADRARMFRLRNLFVVAEVFGLLRQVLRWVQWDHGVPATDVLDHLLDVTEATPDRFPHLTWLTGYFDLFQAAPVGWGRVGEELRALLTEDHGIEASSALHTVLAVQRFLMPTPGRALPETLDLEHDYVAYHRDATASLFTTGRAGGPPMPLGRYPRGSLTVARDPLGLCDDGPELFGDSRASVVQGDFYMASTSAYELYSPLVRLLPHVVRNLTPDEVAAVLPDVAATVPGTEGGDGGAGVHLRPRLGSATRS